MVNDKIKIDEFGKLYDAYVQKIYNFIYYRTHHQPTAEDLTSETFTKALANIARFDSGKGTFSAWLYRIARNTVIDHYRTAKETVDIENVWDLGDDPQISRDLDNRAALKKVQDYLQILPADQREIILLRLWDGLSYREIADLTGKSAASCKMMFSRAIRKLRAESPNVLMLILLYGTINSINIK